MLINLSELLTIEGKCKAFTVPLESDKFETADGTYSIVEKAPVSLLFTNQGNKVLTVKGEAVLDLMMPCARCLELVRLPFSLEIDQVVDMKQTSEDRIAHMDEQFYMDGYNLDVDQLVHNELRLNLPMKVLCDEECKGISSGCGTNPGREACGCDDRPPDPRMSVIQDIFKQSKEV